MVECDYKRQCINKPKQCHNCDRNYENDVTEDNFEPKPLINQKLIDKPNIKKLSTEFQEKENKTK